MRPGAKLRSARPNAGSVAKRQKNAWLVCSQPAIIIRATPTPITGRLCDCRFIDCRFIDRHTRYFPGTRDRTRKIQGRQIALMNEINRRPNQRVPYSPVTACRNARRLITCLQYPRQCTSDASIKKRGARLRVLLCSARAGSSVSSLSESPGYARRRRRNQRTPSAKSVDRR